MHLHYCELQLFLKFSPISLLISYDLVTNSYYSHRMNFKFTKFLPLISWSLKKTFALTLIASITHLSRNYNALNPWLYERRRKLDTNITRSLVSLYDPPLDLVISVSTWWIEYIPYANVHRGQASRERGAARA